MTGKGVRKGLLGVTEPDRCFAFDADGAANETLWHVNFLKQAGVSTVPARDVRCPFIQPEIGITSTPVIDLPTGTLYVLARTRKRDARGDWHYEQKLHALAISTGAEKFGGPVKISARIRRRNFLGFK